MHKLISALTFMCFMVTGVCAADYVVTLTEAEEAALTAYRQQYGGKSSNEDLLQAHIRAVLDNFLKVNEAAEIQKAVEAFKALPLADQQMLRLKLGLN